MTTLKHIFNSATSIDKKPTFKSEQQRKTNLFLIICYMSVISALAAIIIIGNAWFATGNATLGSLCLVLGGSIFCNLISYRLAKGGKYIWGCRLLITANTLTLAYGSWLLGTEVQITLVFVGIITTVVMLLGTWEVIAITGFSAIFSAGLYLAQNIFKLYTPPITLSREIETSINLLTVALFIPMITIVLVLPAQSILHMLEAQNRRLQMALSEKDQTEAELRNSEERYRILFENNPYPTWVFDLKTLAFLAVNEAAIKSYGYSREEFLDMTIKDIRPAEDVPDLLKQTILQGELQDQNTPEQWRHRKKDGTIIDVEITAHTVSFAGRPARAVMAKDITKERHAQETLRMAELKYRTLVEQMPGITYTTSLSGNVGITYVSPQIKEILGFTPEEWISDPQLWVKQLHPEDRMRIWNEIRDTQKAGEPFRSEYRHIARDGRIVWVRTDSVMLRNENGRPYLTQGIILDITERKQAEEALRQSEERLRLALVAGGMGIWDWDIAANNIEWSDNVAQVLDLPHSDWGRTYEDFLNAVHPQDQTRVGESLQKAWEQNIDYEIECRMIWPDKSIHWISGRGRLFRNSAGEPVRMLGTVMDITRRKQSEEALRESEERFRQLTENVRDVFWMSTLDQTELIYVNPAFERIWGRSVDDAYKDPQICLNAAHPEDRQRMLELRARSRLGEEYSEEYRIIRPDGTLRWIWSRAFPIRNQDGEIYRVAGVAEDITERKQAEEELQKVQKLESVGVLAGGIAHDFNNILSGIVGNISLAQLEAGDNPKLEELLQETENAAFRAKSLTQQLLIFAKGGAPVKKSASLKTLLEESVNFALRGSNVRCTFSIPEDLWRVEIDEGQINQVINNLVINADQAMPTGGTIIVKAENVPAQTRDHTLPLKDLNFVKVSIIDEGIGIPEANLQKIFDPYFTTKQKGSGLGLATSFSIVTRHDGFLKAESTLGKGTTFIIYLPATFIQENGSKPLESKKLSTGSGRILIMDDEQMIRTMLKKSLTLTGYEVDLAEDGVQAIEMYRQALTESRPYKIVIMDLTIPGGMGGKEAIKQLLEIDPDVKVLVASGYSNDPIMANCQDYGFQGAVSKPFRLQEIHEKIAEIGDKVPDRLGS